MICDLQKANIWKRISAFLLDIILLSILAVGMAFLLSLVTGYNKVYTRYESRLTAVEEKYGIDLNDGFQYQSLSDETKAKFDAAYEELNADSEATRDLNLIYNLSLINITASLFISFLVLEFILPLIFKNGQTLGKKVFGVGVMRTNGVRVNGPIMFIRTILGKFAVETMIIAYILILFFVMQKLDIFMIILLIALPLANLIIIIATKNNSLLHDLMAQTVTVDLASQMIFDSEEERTAYKAKLAAEAAENAEREKKLY